MQRCSTRSNNKRVSFLHEPFGGVMITIDERLIRLQARAADKQEAIRQAGQLLVDSGYIDAGYIASMLGREDVANTYLGNGIAIPHGLPKDRDLIKQTGIAVVQVPAGVTWNPGETARLIVGIAAKSDEHIEMLRRLAFRPRALMPQLPSLPSSRPLP